MLGLLLGSNYDGSAVAVLRNVGLAPLAVEVRVSLRAGCVAHALDGLAQDGWGGGEVEADEPGAAVAEYVAGAEGYPGAFEEHAGWAGEIADDVVVGGGVRVVQAEGAAVQPG